MNLNELTASKIKEIRHQLGYTAEAMAKDLGISKTAYSQMENGRVEITLSRIELIAQVFNISISEIIPSINNNLQFSDDIEGNLDANNNISTNSDDKLKTLIDELDNFVSHIKKIKSNIFPSFIWLLTNVFYDISL